jgi:FeS assembly SUF system protein
MSEPKNPDTPETPETAAEASTAGTIEERVVEALRTIYDPEIPVDIYELGLIYNVDVDEELKSVHISMTLTSPSCPVAGTLPGEVETKVKAVEGVDDAFVELVWDPPWTMEKLSEAARLQLGLT